MRTNDGAAMASTFCTILNPAMQIEHQQSETGWGGKAGSAFHKPAAISPMPPTPSATEIAKGTVRSYPATSQKPTHADTRPKVRG